MEIRTDIAAAIESVMLYYSENTKRAYTIVLKDWLEFIGCELENATTAHVHRYLDHLRSGGAAGNSIRLKYDVLSSLYGMLEKRGLVDYSVFDRAGAKPPRKNWNRKRHYNLVPFNMVMGLCAVPDRFTDEGIRDRAMLAALFGGALRKSELLALRLKDVQVTEAGTFYLYLENTKAGQPQCQPLPDWAAEAVTRLVEQRKTEGAVEEDWLFTTYRPWGYRGVGSRVDTRTFDRAFKRHVESAGLDPVKYSAHACRATAISKLWADRVEPRQIQHFARHSRLHYTEVYDIRDWSIDSSAAKKIKYS